MSTPLKKPIVSFPTPNLRDVYFVEFVDPTSAYYQETEYGDLYSDQTPNTGFPGAKLTYKAPIETGDGMDKIARMVWCSAREAQEVYNAKISYLEGDKNYPVYTRRYLYLRSDYAPKTKLTTLQGLIKLILVSGGINYKADSYNHVELVFTGGGGTGAAGFGVVVDGVFTEVFLTNGGTGYTSAPTVSALVGSGLNVTAVLQGSTVLLTKEVSQPAEGEFASLWVDVVRVYETLPGPEIATQHQDPETGTNQTTYRQRVALPTDADPVAALQIASVTAVNPGIIATIVDHGLPVSGTTQVTIHGLVGGTTISGSYAATRTGAKTFTIPVNVTVPPDSVYEGYVSPMKLDPDGSYQVIIDSEVKPDDDNGSVTGTKITKTALLPGREVDDYRYDNKRFTYVTTRKQRVAMGVGARALGSTYKGQTIEDSEAQPDGTAWAVLTIEGITLPGDIDVDRRFNEETGGLEEVWTQRLAVGADPYTVGDEVTTDHFVLQSSVKSENSQVDIRQTLIGIAVGGDIAPSRTEIVDGTEPMPRIFVFIAGWIIYGDGYYEHGPFLDVPGGTDGNYSLELHSDATPFIVDISYTMGPDPTPVTVWTVLTNRSRFLPIDDLTLHDDYQLVETNSVLPDQIIETMNDSVPPPSGYVTGDPLVIRYTDRPFHGGPDGMWERRVYSVTMT